MIVDRWLGLFIRFVSAFLYFTNDCDEVFNYWEPVR